MQLSHLPATLQRIMAVVPPDRLCLDQPGVLGDWATGRLGRGKKSPGCDVPNPLPSSSVPLLPPSSDRSRSRSRSHNHRLGCPFQQIFADSIRYCLPTPGMRFVGNICSKRSLWRTYSNQSLRPTINIPPHLESSPAKSTKYIVSSVPT